MESSSQLWDDEPAQIDKDLVNPLVTAVGQTDRDRWLGDILRGCEQLSCPRVLPPAELIFVH